MIRPIRFGKYGLAEDPTGAIITAGGKLYEVTGTYRREHPSGIMVRTRHFNRSPGPDFAASYVRLVLPDKGDYKSNPRRRRHRRNPEHSSGIGMWILVGLGVLYVLNQHQMATQ